MSSWKRIAKALTVVPAVVLVLLTGAGPAISSGFGLSTWLNQGVRLRRSRRFPMSLRPRNRAKR
jgi:hypothetical protein